MTIRFTFCDNSATFLACTSDAMTFVSTIHETLFIITFVPFVEDAFDKEVWLDDALGRLRHFGSLFLIVQLGFYVQQIKSSHQLMNEFVRLFSP